MLTEIEQIKFYEIIKRFRGCVFNYIMDRVKDPVVAEEIAVRVFIRLYNKKTIRLMSEADDRKLKEYIAKVVVSLCYSEFMKREKGWSVKYSFSVLRSLFSF